MLKVNPGTHSKIQVVCAKVRGRHSGAKRQVVLMTVLEDCIAAIQTTTHTGGG